MDFLNIMREKQHSSNSSVFQWSPCRLYSIFTNSSDNAEIFNNFLFQIISKYIFYIYSWKFSYFCNSIRISFKREKRWLSLVLQSLGC